jgi:hypothetical protein
MIFVAYVFVADADAFSSSSYGCLGNSLYMPVAISVPTLVKKSIDGLLLQEHAPKTLEEA